jgi:hypothetical protein
VGRAPRPSSPFHALTGETPVPLFGNTRSSSEAYSDLRSQPTIMITCLLKVANIWLRIAEHGEFD